MEVSLIGFAVLFAICFLGVPLGYAMIIVGTVGFAFARDWLPAFAMVGQQVLDVSTSYGFTVLPLFILMGEFVHRADLSRELYDSGRAWFGHRRGGLAMATVVACGGFAAVCGSSLATAATMTKVAMPAMRRYGYADSLAGGSIAAGGTLGILIPPSVPMVIYGILTETDISQLFIAGIVPGIMLIALFIIAIWAVTLANPSLGPPAPRMPLRERWRPLAQIWGVGALFVLVLGGMYSGVFTPTEGAGVGAAGALLFGIARRRLGFRATVEALVDAGRTSGSIFVVTIGAFVFSNFINIAGLPEAMIAWIQSLAVSPIGIVLAMCAIYIVLGCLFDSLAMLLLTVPVFFPIVNGLGLDAVWFGIIVIVVVELGLITPPIGMNVFVVKAVVGDVPMWRVFRGIVPFVIAMLVGLGIVIYVPELSLFLPRMM
jgi:tripartite ATP-independent transporter DctM subunit